MSGHFRFFFLRAASDFANNGFSNSSELLSEYHKYSPFVYDLYTKPYCRIGAYLVGMATGFYLYQNKNTIKMSKVGNYMNFKF